MRISKTMRVMAGLAVAAVAAAPAHAHHSYAMFDKQKSVTLDGTIKEFQWTNPHSWVQLVVKDPATGKDLEWSLELNSPNRLVRDGWTRTSLKPGDKAVAVMHPLTDGTTGGQLVSITVNGQTLGALASLHRQDQGLALARFVQVVPGRGGSKPPA
jgi:hypothetical protein